MEKGKPVRELYEPPANIICTLHSTYIYDFIFRKWVILWPGWDCCEGWVRGVGQSKHISNIGHDYESLFTSCFTRLAQENKWYVQTERADTEVMAMCNSLHTLWYHTSRMMASAYDNLYLVHVRRQRREKRTQPPEDILHMRTSSSVWLSTCSSTRVALLATRQRRSSRPCRWVSWPTAFSDHTQMYEGVASVAYYIGNCIKYVECAKVMYCTTLIRASGVACVLNNNVQICLHGKAVIEATHFKVMSSNSTNKTLSLHKQFFFSSRPKLQWHSKYILFVRSKTSWNSKGFQTVMITPHSNGVIWNIWFICKLNADGSTWRLLNWNAHSHAVEYLYTNIVS